MSGTEYGLVALTILLPLVIAVVVTLWTLEQARLRSKKNRKRSPSAAKAVAPLVPASAAIPTAEPDGPDSVPPVTSSEN